MVDTAWMFSIHEAAPAKWRQCDLRKIPWSIASRRNRQPEI